MLGEFDLDWVAREGFTEEVMIELGSEGSGKVNQALKSRKSFLEGTRCAEGIERRALWLGSESCGREVGRGWTAQDPAGCGKDWRLYSKRCGKALGVLKQVVRGNMTHIIFRLQCGKDLMQIGTDSSGGYCLDKRCLWFVLR